MTTYKSSIPGSKLGRNLFYIIVKLLSVFKLILFVYFTPSSDELYIFHLYVLKRLSPFLSRLNKLTIFHTFILSNFNYCPLAWHFCSESNSKKLEKIQERTLRFVYDDFKSTYEELLNKANIPFLRIKRIRTMAVETFRILNDIVHGPGGVTMHPLRALREWYNIVHWTSLIKIYDVNTR